jgi:hypothetical protein
MSESNPFLYWIWRNGGRREFWAVFENQVGDFIKNSKIPALSKEAQMNLAMGSFLAPADIAAAPKAPTANILSAVIPIWWHGGMISPHLHFKGNVYVLNTEQWVRFSAPILENLKAKLNSAKTVSFGKMIAVSESINAIV